MLAESSRLEPMLGQVLAYGGQRPDQFGSYGLVWHDGDDASVVVSFTSDLDVHRAALETAVEHPSELIVCQVAASGEVAQAVEATLVKELEGRFLSIGRGGGAIEVVLAANEELLAGERVARYRDAIDVTVGALAYPLDQASEVCDDQPAAASLPGLRIEVVAPAGPVNASGVEPLQLTVMLTNDRSEPIRFTSGTARRDSPRPLGQRCVEFGDAGHRGCRHGGRPCSRGIDRAPAGREHGELRSAARLRVAARRLPTRRRRSTLRCRRHDAALLARPDRHRLRAAALEV